METKVHKNKGVSIIIPTYKPDKKVLEDIKTALKNQSFEGEKEILILEMPGLANSLNYGVKKAKHDFVVSLHHDCIPSSTDWLEKLIEPLKNEKFVASVSQIELPYSLWIDFDWYSKLLTAKEAGILQPLMDEKAVAYRKSALIEAGLFDDKTFKTCGEDFDMYFKLKKQGKIAYPKSKVYHIHKTNFKSRLRKELQYADGYGALFRIYDGKMPNWQIAILKAIPFLGILIFFLSLKKSIWYHFILWFGLSIILNFTYCYGFWNGFIRKKQSLV